MNTRSYFTNADVYWQLPQKQKEKDLNIPEMGEKYIAQLVSLDKLLEKR